MSAAAAYATRLATLSSERDTLLRLWDGSLGDREAMAAKFDWYYGQHIEGAPTVLMLCHGPDQTPVGAGTLGPRQMTLQGRPLRAGVRVDLAVEAAHRTLFPALHLQRAISRAGLEGFDLLYGMPNAAAEKVVRRLGVQQEVAMVRYVKVLRWAPYLARKVPHWAAAPGGMLMQGLQQMGLRSRQALRAPRRHQAWLSEPDADFDTLWARCAEPAWLMGRRDQAFLRWRFVQQPGTRHRFFVMRGGRSGRLLAYAVCNREGATKHVRDILVEGHNPQLAREFLHRLAIAAYREGATSLSLNMVAPPVWAQILADGGFSPREQRPLFIDWSAARQNDLGPAVTMYGTDADEDQ
jgi:hypothetical protein